MRDSTNVFPYYAFITKTSPLNGLIYNQLAPQCHGKRTHCINERLEMLHSFTTVSVRTLLRIVDSLPVVWIDDETLK